MTRAVRPLRRATFHRWRGIYLAAFGGGPITLADMTDDDVTAMFRPKLDAVSLLHQLSLRHSVRQFVLFSSISGLLDSRWLAHYAATTTFLDTFALRPPGRRSAGYGHQLGTLEVAGRQPDPRKSVRSLSTSGLEPMADEVAIQALPLLTGPGAPARSDRRRRGLGPAGHGVSHPGGPAHRGRPADHWRECGQSGGAPAPNSGMHCATPNRRVATGFWSIT